MTLSAALTVARNTRRAGRLRPNDINPSSAGSVTLQGLDSLFRFRNTLNLLTSEESMCAKGCLDVQSKSGAGSLIVSSEEAVD